MLCVLYVLPAQCLSLLCQRVLEFCDDPKIQQSMIAEILQSVCLLAQDQYGNYVVQVMMKDQFANYVIQKALETCADEQRELILSRVKVHLNALKKYTYGKHIVARVEKLVAAGGKTY
ncbi:hypothetical protein BHM03_00041083 [Ensete ventricosum]|uniref:PUM-HD domain-containing protein n=1 Tax=Ensete ventricosum TaxID=4639 RepID=A0A445MKB2_ENSVE|nr:hypothetical protein BHM03_00041083 [Ensete ventricosum]